MFFILHPDDTLAYEVAWDFSSITPKTDAGEENHVEEDAILVCAPINQLAPTRTGASSADLSHVHASPDRRSLTIEREVSNET